MEIHLINSCRKTDGVSKVTDKQLILFYPSFFRFSLYLSFPLPLSHVIPSFPLVSYNKLKASDILKTTDFHPAENMNTALLHTFFLPLFSWLESIKMPKIGGFHLTENMHLSTLSECFNFTLINLFTFINKSYLSLCFATVVLLHLLGECVCMSPSSGMQTMWTLIIW